MTTAKKSRLPVLPNSRHITIRVDGEQLDQLMAMLSTGSASDAVRTAIRWALPIEVLATEEEAPCEAVEVTD